MSQRFMRRGALVFAGALVSLGLVAIGTSATATPSSTSTTTTTTTTTRPPASTTTTPTTGHPTLTRSVIKRGGTATLGAPHEVNVADLPNTPNNQAIPDLGARRKDGTRGPSPSQEHPVPSTTQPQPNVSASTVTPPNKILQNFAGTALAQSSCNCQPPDPNGAVGNGRVVEVDNLSIQVWTRADNPNTTLVKRTALRTFLNTNDSLSDPRVFFDNAWHRWVLVVTVIPATASDTPSLWIAASQTAAPGALWFVAKAVFPSLPPGTLLDSPMVGMDENSIVVSTNEFDFTDTYLDTFAFAVAKQRLYNGLSATFPIFPTLDFSTHPAFVEGIPQNQDDTLYLVASGIPNATGDFHVYAMTNSSHPATTAVVSVGTTTATASATLPPAAPQPGTPSAFLDTGDGRLVAAPHQLSTKLWFARAVELSGRTVVEYGNIDAGTLSVVSANAYSTTTTYDWNPAIAVGPAGHVFLVWASLNPGLSNNPQPNNDEVATRFAGLLPTDTVQLVHGIRLQSGFHTSEDRFGDYASVAIDPGAYLIPGTSTVCASGNTALLVNESFDSSHHWVDRIARVGYC